MNKTKKLPEKLVSMIEKSYFTISEEDDCTITFSRFSPEGQDFNFSVDMENDLFLFANNIFSVYCDFDVSYETSLWLDEEGHGKNGAPYDMYDVYKDMEECKSYIYELYRIVTKYLDKQKG